MSEWSPGPQENLSGPLEATAAASAGRPRVSLYLLIAAAALTAGGLAAGGYGIASAASSHGRAPQSASQALATASGPSTSPPVRPRSGGPAGPGDFGLGGGRGGSIGQGGTVTQVTPTTITVDTLFDATLTVTTDSSTIYSERGKKIARSAVAVGDEVAFGSPGWGSNANGSGTHGVTLVEIVQPHVLGKVVSMSGSQLVVTQQDGLNVTVNTSTSTTYGEAGESVPATDVGVGTVVSVTGTVSSDHDQIDATTIEIVLPTVAGRVTDVSGTTITITGFDGTAETVTTDSTTVFRNQIGTTTIASVAKGDLLQASGTPGHGNTFAAATVFVGSGRPSVPGVFAGPGGFRGGPSGAPMAGGGAWHGSFNTGALYGSSPL